MLIDWFTVVAQIFNFLILVWLLKRFLYAPILDAIDAREKRIAAQVSDAAAKEAGAQTARDEYTRKNEALEEERAEILRRATMEAAALREQLMDAARSSAESLRIKQQKQLNDEYQALTEEVARRTRAEVFFIAKKMLMDLAGSDLEDRMVEIFIRRLQELDEEEKRLLASIQSRVLVRSAFELPQRATLEDALRKLTRARIDYETVEGLISGIELVAQGQKIAWSIADHLASLEKDVDALLKTQPSAH